ncbi:hypothetical protein BD779DRAFT_1479047 [Infundibulicybe gibba]|nr:hypothetical protein BD779DRAFT_1479047 [Infundibulicybe gibba]
MENINIATGTLNTVSPEEFEATFTVGETCYKYTGTTGRDVTTSFDNVKVGLTYTDLTLLRGSCEFEAVVGLGHIVLLLESPDFNTISYIAGEVLSGVRVKGIGSWSMSSQNE